MDNQNSTPNKEQKKESTVQRRNLGPLLTILIFVCFIPAALHFYNLYQEKNSEYIEKLKEEEKIKQDVARLENRIEQMKEHEKYLNTDDGIERAARDKLGLVRPKEIPFIIVSSGDGGSSAVPSAFKVQDIQRVDPDPSFDEDRLEEDSALDPTPTPTPSVFDE